MRKVLLSLLVLALACPAFAAVSITGYDVEDPDGQAALAIDTDGAVVRGVALKVTLTGDATLADLTPVYVNPAFNVFIDSAFEIGETYAIGDGTPFANADAAGEATVGATVFSISMGVLDEEGAQAGYTSPTGGEDLIIFATGAGNVCVEVDTLRGGIVGDGTIEASIGACFDVTAGEVECMKATHPAYAAWVAFGKPSCWCFARQCRGDADGLQVAATKTVPAHWVGAPDLGILTLGWRKSNSDPAFAQFICADFDKTEVAATKTVPAHRVGAPDLGLLTSNWRASVVAECDNTDFNFWTN